MDISRRSALTSILGASAVVGAAACSQRNENDANSESSSPAPPEITPLLPALPQTLLVNRRRAFEVMSAAGVEALICARPENIYYLTNHYPQLVKMGMTNLAYAVLPLNPAESPILVIGEFAYYLGATERATPELVDVRLYTSPAEPDTFVAQRSLQAQIDVRAQGSFLPAAHDYHPLNEVESSRRAIASRAAHDMAATSEAALVRVVRELALAGKRVAVDEQALEGMLERTGIPIVRRDAERMLRIIRLQKSNAEIVLARYVARENAEASLAAARTVRDGATFQEVRVEYARQCASRLLTPSFMVIDGIIPEMAPAKVEEGRAFLIDCVSHHQNYHGDYGRTVCVGEPTREIARATDAISRVWDALLPQLVPGMRYSEIAARAAEAFAKADSDAGLICNPHSVGLHHTDEPGAEGYAHWVKDDLELVAGMILSVDLPVVEVGLGGSAHLEDLVLIGREGAELLNDNGDRVIIV